MKGFAMANLTMFSFDLGDDQRISVLVADREQFLTALRNMAGITTVSSHLSELALELNGSKTPQEVLKTIRNTCDYVSLKTTPLLSPRTRVE